MISGDWQQHLSRTLRPSQNPADPTSCSPPRLVIVGVGQVLRGDDAMGVAVAERLIAAGRDDDATWVIIAGHAPENCLGQIIRLHPNVVLFVDAAALDEPPGAVRLLAADEAADMPGTHTPSLGMAATFLKAETGCSVFLLAMAPAVTSFDTGLSAAGKAAVEEAVEVLLRL